MERTLLLVVLLAGCGSEPARPTAARLLLDDPLTVFTIDDPYGVGVVDMRLPSKSYTAGFSDGQIGWETTRYKVASELAAGSTVAGAGSVLVYRMSVHGALPVESLDAFEEQVRGDGRTVARREEQTSAIVHVADDATKQVTVHAMTGRPGQWFHCSAASATQQTELPSAEVITRLEEMCLGMTWRN